MTSHPGAACLDQEALTALISGQLLLEQNPQLEAHLAECSRCRRLLAAASAGLDSAPDREASERDDFPRLGDVLAGKYTLEKVLGRGGMGTVFAARHGELGQVVAIKVLHSTGATAAARFLREAQISAGLIGEHNARVFDFGRMPNGDPFLVMEHLVGEDLSCVIGRGPLAAAQALRYALQICAGLAEAHAAGVVHRDLKPNNVFVTRRADGTDCLKVLDYGISKRVTSSSTASSQDLTENHSLLGSPAYMSPEQLRESSRVDARADIWSLGVVLYELLTGTRPFKATRLSALSMSVAADTPSPPSKLNPSIPRVVDRAVMRCLDKNPDARFTSAAELALALRCAARPCLRPRLRNRGVAVMGCIATLAVSGSLPGYPQDTNPEHQESSVLPGPPRRERLTQWALEIRCDSPLAPGSISLFTGPPVGAQTAGRAWPLKDFCGSTTDKDDVRRELERLGQSPGALLHPPHPFYRVDIRAHPDRIAIHVERLATAPVELRVTGQPCELIESMVVVPVEHRELGASAQLERNPGGATGPCLYRARLPFEAMGKQLELRFEPARYTASDIVFERDVLDVVLRAPKKAPRKAPPQACVPPRFCRD